MYSGTRSILALALLALASPALGQGATAQPGVSNWPTNCAAMARNAPVVCTATAAAFVRETGQKMLEVRLRVTPEQPTRLFVVGPFGTAVQQPYILSLDGAELVRAPVYTCEQDGCYANVEMSDELIAKLSGGEALTVSFSRLNGEVVAVPLPLAGFAEAYTAIR